MIALPIARPIAAAIAAALFDQNSGAYSGPSLRLGFSENTYLMGAIGKPPSAYEFDSLITFTRASGGGRFNSSGVYEWVGNDVPRLDYDPVTLQPRGILIEEQRTNLLTYSSDFANAAWTKAGATVTANSAVAPDGTLSADTITLPNAYNFVFGNMISVTAGQVFTVSVYAKRNTGAFVLRLSNSPSTKVIRALVDTSGVGRITPKASTNGVLVSVDKIAVNAEWGRYVLVGSLNTADTQVSMMIAHEEEVSPGAVVWGAQLEAGAFPTSYIPTVASQVTRAADVCSVNALAPWYNPLEGTLVVKLSAYSGQTGFRNVVIMHAGAATQLYVSMETMGITVSGVTSAAPINTSRPVPLGIAGSYKVREPVRASKNGSSALVAVNNVAAALPFTQMAIGRSTFYGVDLFSGVISSITYYPRAIDVQQASA